MLEPKVVIEYINKEDVFKHLTEVMGRVRYAKYLDYIDLSDVYVERYFGIDDEVSEEEVTIWLKFDEDVYDTWEHPVNNEITVKVPMDEEWSLEDLSLEFIKEIIKVKNRLVKF